jgi:diguanylate cyclase (GGDEF)-like protein/PAS domain S-box-containing protein
MQTPPPPAPSQAQPMRLAAQVHAALMPDYNRKATAFWWSVVVLGLFCFVASVRQVLTWPALSLLQVAGGTALALAMAIYPVKVPRTNQVFSLGDVFIFLLLLMLGPEAGCIAAGLESFLSSCRTSRRWTTRIGSGTIAAFTMFVCGKALHYLTGDLAQDQGSHSALLVVAAMSFGGVYFACSGVLMTTVALLKRNQKPQWSDLLGVFGWVGAASAGAAALAALLHITARLAGMGVMLTIVPMLGLLLTTLHFFNRQQDADAAVRDAAAQALEREAVLARSQALQREAELAAQHMRDLEVSERRFQSAFAHASIGMALLSLDGTIHLANPALAGLLGCEDPQLAGRLFQTFVDPADQGRLVSSLGRLSRGSSDVMTIELCCRRPDGQPVWVSVSCSVFSQPDDDGPSLIMQIQDVTARRTAELELHHRANHDKLTGLANRDSFHRALELAIERADGGPGRAFAVLFIDFDRFKLINDSKGHKVGDEFLIAASRLLSRCLRKGDLLARLGGDEFAILAQGLNADGDAEDLATRLLLALDEPLRLNSIEVQASASVGITFSSLGYSKPEDMLRDADIAMYRAKAEGKARYALFDVELHVAVNKRVHLEVELRGALSRSELHMAFQPLFDLNSCCLIGFEALARWTHAELGPVSPASFIPVAEESGLISQLTDFALFESCRQLKTWQLAQPGAQHLHVHVNVAARDLADPCFVQRIESALSDSKLDARYLVIELTENILMAELSAAMGTLTALRAMGLTMSIDDFGTGYSSLSHLAVLPIDSLKIDRSFVRDVQPDSKEAAIIRAIVLLGSSLGKEVIAEGIETESQMTLLRDLGCDVGQGYHLARPLNADAATALLQRLGPALHLQAAAPIEAISRPAAAVRAAPAIA